MMPSTPNAIIDSKMGFPEVYFSIAGARADLKEKGEYFGLFHLRRVLIGVFEEIHTFYDNSLRRSIENDGLFVSFRARRGNRKEAKVVLCYQHLYLRMHPCIDSALTHNRCHGFTYY